MTQLQATYQVSVILSDDLRSAIQAFANETTRQKRLLAYVLVDYMDKKLQHGEHAKFYDAVADEWNSYTGEYITGRTVRYWCQSVKQYSKAELKEYTALTNAQLIEAVKLANDCQFFDITPQEICEWCIDNEIQSVREMRAHWLPTTGTPDAIDPPALSGIIRLFGRLIKQDNPHYARLQEIITEIRGWL
jgi:hypothetical protein